MRVRANNLIIVAALCLLPCGCATTSAPKDWLSTPQQMQWNVHGGWLELYTMTPETRIAGELLAVSPDSVAVLTGDGFVMIALQNVSRAKLTAYHFDHAPHWYWTLGGFASCATHGYWAVFTGPLWLLTGSVVSVASSYAPQEYMSASRGWEDASLWARFPAGLPETLNRSGLVLPITTRREPPR